MINSIKFRFAVGGEEAQRGFPHFLSVTPFVNLFKITNNDASRPPRGALTLVSNTTSPAAEETT